VLKNGGRVDVLLERGEERLGCEVGVSSTIEQEVSNAKKCLSAGLSQVAMVCPDEGFGKRLREALAQELPEAEHERVMVYSPQEFLSYLGTLPHEEREGERLGWKVKVAYGGEEARRKSKQVAEVIVRSVRRLRGE
jgi:hypothetical protein